MPLITILLIMLTPWQVSESNEFQANVSKDNGAKDNEVPGSDKIVHDISAEIQNTQTFGIGNISYTEILGENAPPFLYYEANDNAGNEICLSAIAGPPGTPKVIRKCSEMGVAGLSVMFSNSVTRNDILSLPVHPMIQNIIGLATAGSSFLKSVVISTESADCECTLLGKLKGYLENIDIIRKYETNGIVKLGFEYTQNFLECQCEESLLTLFPLVDLTVLKIPIQPGMLSYGLFAQEVTKIVLKNRNFVRKFNPNCILYIRLVTESGMNKLIKEQQMGRYHALVLKYIMAWNNGQEIFITPLPPQNTTIIDNNQFLKENVTASISYSTQPTFILEDGKASQDTTCDSHETVNFFQSIFQNILLFEPTSRLLGQLIKSCKDADVNKGPTHFTNMNVKMNLILSNNIYRLSDQLEQINEMTSGSNSSIQLHAIYAQYDQAYPFKAKHLELFLQNLTYYQSQKITIGCYISELDTKPNNNLSLIVANIQEMCKDSFHLSSIVVIPLILYARSIEHLLTDLYLFQQLKQEFEEQFVGKLLAPIINLIEVSSKASARFNLLHLEESYQFYCNENLKLANEYYQIIISYANIHEWTNVALFADTMRHFHAGIWRDIEIDREVQRSVTNTPLFVRSNSEKAVNGFELTNTFPCIHHIEHRIETAISFHENQYSGATFKMKLRRSPDLTAEELKTAVLFALDRFPSVELRASSPEDLKNTMVVLSPKIVAAVNNSRINSLQENTTLTYVEIPMKDILSGELEIESVNQNKHIAVHVTGWESFTFLQKYTTFTIPSKFGITVQDCIEEMNMKMARLNKLPFINSVSYLVCNVKSMVSDNSNIKVMLNYLGTLFYTKTYIEKSMSHRIRSEYSGPLEVIFRINLSSEGRQCPDNKDDSGRDRFLRFMNEVNQHSVAYKIRYFLVDAFEEEVNSRKCHYTWWRVENYSDLRNTSVYVDREYEFLGRQTKLSIRLPAENSTDTKNDTQVHEYNQAYFIFAPVVVVFMISILVLWVKLHRSNRRFLTEQEINQFRNGCDVSNNEMEMTNADAANTMYMKFSENFEIPEWKVDLQGILGCGQFGMVHKGVLTDHGEVAVKVPRSDCAKEQFLSTLSELKILCHIGSHTNIVSFLGACTKKIGSGKLLIVIEYCENGSLLGHLRKLQQPDVESGETVPVDLPRLYAFSYQIACGMEYVAEKRIIHGDLATRNVLLTSELTCKIADFGLSRRLYELNEYVKTSKEPLPWRWMAPESLKNLEFTVKSDVWSYGVTLWEIFSLGAVPYPGKTWTDEFLQELVIGYRMGKAEHASDEVHDIMLHCWRGRKEERLSFTELKINFAALKSDEYTVLNE